MTDLWQMGPILIRLSMLYLILSIAAGFLVMKTILKRKSPQNMPFIDVLSTSMLLALLIWKLSPMLTNPSLIMDPFSLLLYPGTPLGIQLALAGALLYAIYGAWKRKIDWKAAMDTIVMGLIASSIVFLSTHWQYGLPTSMPWGISISNPDLRYHPTNVYKLLLLIPAAWRLNQIEFGQGKAGYSGLQGLGVIWLLISLFDPKLTFIFGLTKEQVLAVSGIFVGGMVMMIIRYTKSSERT
ncbi:hypothetical protein L1N85_24250 [Paenibacillus alkaliterrae]|uniref:hypothetical protein n=1 Tax=Paenibacillus alkaliterrae TaxID=320909 RepID=UPI001F40B30A|nr:hypothetical protein [Paenibacillus alkaliterrae]MCF2941459.1 hypothetical protein [Paenibacillus alkaliterrae]